jgi:hypothetical protein
MSLRRRLAKYRRRACACDREGADCEMAGPAAAPFTLDTCDSHSPHISPPPHATCEGGRAPHPPLRTPRDARRRVRLRRTPHAAAAPRAVRETRGPPLAGPEAAASTGPQPAIF